jgi:short subunit fatty acids transporter
MEIIPKPKRKIPSLETLFLYFSILIFIFSIFASFYFWFQEKSKKKEISQIEEKISVLKTPGIKKTEEEVSKYQKKISDFSKLIKGYLFYSKIFSYLEQKTHKQIYFSKMDLDFENSTISLSGKSPNFSVLAQQLEVFRGDPFLKTQLKELDLGKEGKADFKIEITFDKSILK